LSSGVAAIAAGFFHTCAVLASTGGVQCWGLNNFGQLGDGTTTDRYAPTSVVGLSSGVAAIAASGAPTCALLASTGGVQCWGYNNYGQLGDGTTTDRYVPTSVELRLPSPPPPSPPPPSPPPEPPLPSSAIAAGAHHTCALLASTGGVQCWGYNYEGELGNGTTTDQHVPMPISVAGLSSGVAAIDAGDYHTCAVLASTGGVQCWGYNYNAQLGDGTTGDRNVPTSVVGLSSSVAAIAAGSAHTCAVLASTGGVQCWGNNYYGQLGDGTTFDRHVPTSVVSFASG
jgi:alpha-tubulin suppressor-like RCC1 family protein